MGTVQYVEVCVMQYVQYVFMFKAWGRVRDGTKLWIWYWLRWIWSEIMMNIFYIISPLLNKSILWYIDTELLSSPIAKPNPLFFLLVRFYIRLNSTNQKYRLLYNLQCYFYGNIIFQLTLILWKFGVGRKKYALHLQVTASLLSDSEWTVNVLSAKQGLCIQAPEMSELPDQITI